MKFVRQRSNAGCHSRNHANRIQVDCESRSLRERNTRTSVADDKTKRLTTMTGFANDNHTTTKSINARHLFSGLELLLVTRRARIKVAAEKEILNSANFEPARTVSAAPAGRVCPVGRPGPLPGPFEAEHLAAPAWPEAVSPPLTISQYPGARSVSTPARVWSVPRAPRPLVPRHIKVSTPARRMSVPQPHRVSTPCAVSTPFL